MRKPVVISIGFHAAILLATLVVLPAPKPFDVKPIEAIQVDISTISDKTQQMATTKDEAPKDVKPAPKQTKVIQDVKPAPKVADEVKTAANEPTPPPEPVKTEPPKPKPPKPEPPKPVEPTPPDSSALKELLKTTEPPPPEKKPEPAPPKPVETKKVEKKKVKPNFDEIAALLDKQKGEKTAPAKPSKDAGAPKQAAKDAQGNDAAMTATIIDALVSRVKECFNVPPAARDANLSVKIHFQLSPDGSVIGQPEVRGSSADPIFDATARAAVSAIVECQKYELPPDQYDLWKDNTLDFNPNLLFGT
jgi:outer membrane biosynthesis protein TonB